MYTNEINRTKDTFVYQYH